MDVVRLAMERRAALKVRVLELDDFIRTAETLLASVAQRVSGGHRREGALEEAGIVA
jgi:hypothetical protein